VRNSVTDKYIFVVRHARPQARMLICVDPSGGGKQQRRITDACITRRASGDGADRKGAADPASKLVPGVMSLETTLEQGGAHAVPGYFYFRTLFRYVCSAFEVKRKRIVEPLLFLGFLVAYLVCSSACLLLGIVTLPEAELIANPCNIAPSHIRCHDAVQMYTIAFLSLPFVVHDRITHASSF
jgi:hypothetical protein